MVVEAVNLFGYLKGVWSGTSGDTESGAKWRVNQTSKNEFSLYEFSCRLNVGSYKNISQNK